MISMPYLIQLMKQKLKPSQSLKMLLQMISTPYLMLLTKQNLKLKPSQSLKK